MSALPHHREPAAAGPGPPPGDPPAPGNRPHRESPADRVTATHRETATRRQTIAGLAARVRRGLALLTLRIAIAAAITAAAFAVAGALTWLLLTARRDLAHQAASTAAATTTLSPVDLDQPRSLASASV